MWYSDKFWTDVCAVETRARWNSKLAREGRGAKKGEDVQDLISETSSQDYNQHYMIPSKPRSNVHYCAGTLQNGMDTPDSFRNYRNNLALAKLNKRCSSSGGSSASCSSASSGGSSSRLLNRRSSSASTASTTSDMSLFEVTDGSYFYAPSCGYFRIGQMNPANNNSCQFATCMKNPGFRFYEGYDWRFGKRVKNLNLRTQHMMRSGKSGKNMSDFDLMQEVKDIQRDVASDRGGSESSARGGKK